MAGVNVLNVIEQTRLPDWAIIGMLLCIVAIMIFLFELFTESNAKRMTVCGIGLACTLALLFSFWCAGKTIFSEEIVQYECTIDSNVSFVELQEKYTVIEQRGDIWVLEEKTNGKVD